MKLRVRLGWFSLLPFFVISPLLAQPLNVALDLAVRRLDARRVQLSWPATATGFVLEQADALGAVVNWNTVPQTPVLAGGQFSVTLDTSVGHKFFRLHAPLVTIVQSSPIDGESGVAVTRETIVHFSAPLATNTVIGKDSFYAGFGGRRLLSRVELSSDRTKATLFYLEPMPGSTRVAVVFDGTGLADENGRPIDADGDGRPGGATVIAFDTLNLTALAGTAVIGTVYASELVPGSDTGTNAVNQPLAGVTITVDGREQDLRAVTDTNGNFTLTPAPPGPFFVHIDGRTAVDAAAGIHYPDKSYYPFVGKAWDAVAGKTNNLAGGTGRIYLPLITAGTLQPVSMTSDTTISFPPSVVASNPALAGVSITVPANSLFGDDGTRGGKVGIAAVPPDRLPGPLPPGLEPPLVITVQTDGPLNFDRPAPVCFPNLRDPVLGTPLPAGSQQELISFNHKKGVWEGVGSMTVSADGKFICTDPGVGILQPGWHGVAPKPDEPPPPDCDGGASKAGLATLLSPGLADHGAECQKALEDCLARELQILGDKVAQCNIFYLSVEKDPAGFAKCVKDALDIHPFEIKICRWKWDNCTAPPPPPPPPPAPPPKPKVCKPPKGPKKSSLTLQSPSRISKLALDPIVEQIGRVFDQIEILTSPYSTSSAPWPPELAAQVISLLEQANALAGGDAASYIRSYLLQLEIEAAAHDTLDEPSGNAPAYPVLYVAEILRPSGNFFLRGKTEPYGQYALFVPRDGILLSVHFYDPESKFYGSVRPRLRADAPWRLPSFTLYPIDATFQDSDHDGLPDAVELVCGTDPGKADSDGDGIPDGAEVDQGTDPLNGLAAQTGLIATAKTPGAAVDVCASNDLIVTAEGAAGVSILNAYSGENPTILAHVPTPGNAQRVAAAFNFIAVALGDAGLAVIDINDPPAARIVHQLNLGATAQAVATAGSIAYVGLTSGFVVAVDLASGTILESVDAGGAVHDLGIEGDLLYVLRGDQLRAYQFADGTLQFAGASAPLSFFAEGITGLRRLFVGGGVAYATSYPGYDTISVTNAAAMTRLGNATNSGPNSFKQIVANGSGLGVATVGVNPRDDGTHDVYLYDVSDPTQTVRFLTALPTPGLARALSLYKGLAYVADGAAGLQVVNYLPYDNRGITPTISLTASFALTSGVIEEGKLVRVTALTTDDVQVRNVEFYVDGVKVVTDGNFPFEHRFITPALSAAKSTLTLRACAIDTGGNSACTPAYTLTLVPDATPPVVRRTLPGANTVPTSAPVVFVYFSEPVDLSTLNAADFKLTFAGADNKLDTADDVPAGGTISWRETLNAAALSFSTPLQFGLYRGTVTGIRDVAGNLLQNTFNWSFWMLAGGADGDEDDDGLLNTDEIARGLNPFSADTDGDGWFDGVEVSDGTDPLNPNSSPRAYFVGRPLLDVVLPSFDEIGTTGLGVTMGGPPVEAVFPAFDEIDATGGLTMGRPPVEIMFPSLDEVSSGSGVTMGLPPLEIVFPALDEIDSILTGITLGRPPVSTRYVP